MKLFQLAKNNYNGSTVVVVDHLIGKLIEGLFDFVLIRGEEFELFPKHLKDYEHRHEVLSGEVFSMTNSNLRDLCIAELSNRGHNRVQSCKCFLG